MRILSAAVVLTIVVARPAIAPAQVGLASELDRGESPEAPPLEARLSAEDAYCRYLESIADAERALLMAPEALISGGLINPGSASSSEVTGGGRTAGRATAGLRYSLGDLYRSTLVSDRAVAECRRHRAQAALAAVLELGDGIGRAAGLRAKRKALDAALAEAEKERTSTETRLEEGAATVKEVDTFLLRVESLRAARAATVRELVQLEALPPLPEATLSEVLSDYRAADRAVEEARNALRSSKSWDVELRAGYDHILSDNDSLPVFGLAQASFNFGRLWQGGAHDRAIAARDAWLHETQGDETSRLGRLARSLMTQLAVERQRLTEVARLESAMADRLRAMSEVGGAAAREYRSSLWFEARRLEAERAYLAERVRMLASFVAKGSDEASAGTSRD